MPSQIPTPLTRQTLELLITYAQAPNVRLRNKIVELNIGLVRKIAHRIKSQCKEPYEDLEQVGCIGLIQAVERFNASKGCAFSSFAVPYIRGEMLHYLRDRGSLVKIPRYMQDLYREAQRFIKAFGSEHGRIPAATEISAALGVTRRELQEIEVAISNRTIASLDTRLCQEVADADPTIAALTAPISEWLDDPSDDVEVISPAEYVEAALAQLPEPARNVIYASFVQNRPRKEIAAESSVSPMTVRRRIQGSLVQISDIRARRNQSA